MVSKAKTTPRKTRLKVFRTAIGFHDAYVAAPNRRAALAAWGTDKDLFARRIAEEVTDAALMEEPLSAPGTVFRQLRSMPAEDPEVKPSKTRARRSGDDAAPKNPMQSLAPSPPPPRPSDEEVADAERALEAARKQHAQEQRDLEARERELATERRTMVARQARAEHLLKTKLKAVRKDYDARLAAWQKAVDEGHRA